MKITTVLELEHWMTENGIKNTFTPRHRYTSDEGLGLEELEGLYVWYFVERGQRQNIKYFRNEQEAVEFVLQYLVKGEPY